MRKTPHEMRKTPHEMRKTPHEKKNHHLGISVLVLLVSAIIIIGIIRYFPSSRADGYLSGMPQLKESLAVPVIEEVDVSAVGESETLPEFPRVAIKTDHSMVIDTYDSIISLTNVGGDLFCIFDPHDSSKGHVLRVQSERGYEVISPDSRKIMKVMSVTKDEIVLNVYDEGFRVLFENHIN